MFVNYLFLQQNFLFHSRAPEVDINFEVFDLSQLETLVEEWREAEESVEALDHLPPIPLNLYSPVTVAFLQAFLHGSETSFSAPAHPAKWPVHYNHHPHHSLPLSSPQTVDQMSQ